MRAFALLAGITAALGACPLWSQSLEDNLRLISLPPGFTIEVFSTELPEARSLALGEQGTVFVGTRGIGSVFALQDTNGDWRADRVFTLARGLYSPNGVQVRDGDLYVAEVNRILRFDDIEQRLSDPPAPVVVFDRLPSERHHGWKFIRFGPDGMLYIPIGAPCNVCEQRDDRYGTIARIAKDGSGFEIFARGVRNSVGFDWHPETGELWFTDNGRDMLGDNIPPDELNHAPEAGLHFGFPYLHGRTVRDPQFGPRAGDRSFTVPAQELGPHVASLGMRFYTGAMFPETYRNQIFIAEHGSWNRSIPIGYRLMLVRLDGNRAVSYKPFAEGWLQGGRAWGRPVDVEVMSDGSLLVSDDRTGVIYRIAYHGA